MNFKNLLFVFIVTLSLLSFKTTYAQNEYLISHEKLIPVPYTPASIEIVLPGFLPENFPVSFDSVVNVINAKYDVDIYKIKYYCEHPIHGKIMASGAVAVPLLENIEVPLMVYQHGTTFNWDGVPSYMSDEHYIGALFSTSGYVSLMPDYLGLGDSPHMHPYSHAQSTAYAGRDMIRAFKEMAPEIGIVWNEEIFITGYSQGGHGAMALFRTLEEDHCDEFTVTACSALSGAYSISGVMQDVMFQEYSSPTYLPYVIVGYQSVYPELLGNTSFKAPFKEEFGALNEFQGDSKAFFEIIDEYDSLGIIPRVPIEMLKEELVEEFKNDDNHPFKIAMRESDNYDWQAQAPLYIQGCCDDEQVSIENARITRDSFQAKGKTNLEYVDYCDEYPDARPLNHGGCIPYCLIQTKMFFDKYRSSAPVDCNPLSVASHENTIDFSLYPNPVNGNFTILSIEKPIVENVTLTFYNSNGQLIGIKNENGLRQQTKINTENLTNGFYILNIKSKTHNFGVPFFVSK